MREERWMRCIDRLKLAKEPNSTRSALSRQVIPEIYNTFSKEIVPNGTITKVLEYPVWVASSSSRARS